MGYGIVLPTVLVLGLPESFPSLNSENKCSEDEQWHANAPDSVASEKLPDPPH